MTDTPRKTLTIKRSGAAGSTVSRSGKRIIRREDLPNVQKPGKGSNKPTGKAKPKKPARKTPPKKSSVSPSDLRAKELNDRLNGFRVWLEFRPLAIGTDKAIHKLVNDECFPGGSKNVVQKVLTMHTRHGRYLQALLDGTARYHLDGTPAGEVIPYQKQLAAEMLQQRVQGKS